MTLAGKRNTASTTSGLNVFISDENMPDNYSRSVLFNDLHPSGKLSGQATVPKTETGFMNVACPPCSDFYSHNRG